MLMSNGIPYLSNLNNQKTNVTVCKQPYENCYHWIKNKYEIDPKRQDQENTTTTEGCESYGTANIKLTYDSLTNNTHQ